MPTHDELADALFAAGVTTGAAEVHGILCGMLCADRRVEADAAVGFVLGLEAPEQNAAIPHELLTALLERTRATFEQAEPDFHLLLPDDDEGIAVRVAALADWCRGFLAGLAQGGVRDLEALPGDAAEIVRDLLAISEVVPGGRDSDEQQERALTEIEEFVRVGVQLVFEERHPVTGEAPPTRH